MNWLIKIIESLIEGIVALFVITFVFLMLPPVWIGLFIVYLIFKG